MAVNTEVKGQLAKLLATENLNVEHRKITTAYFDVDRRVLALPIWVDVSNDVYDLLERIWNRYPKKNPVITQMITIRTIDILM